MAKNEEKPFRLEPRKLPTSYSRSEQAAWASAFKAVMRHTRMTSSKRPRSVSGRTPVKRTYNQRCAVRVTYAKNKRAGQWRAHGRYLARESATLEGDSHHVGFDRDKDDVDIAGRLHEWQQSGDERLWKLIISPEFAERLDLKQLTRELMSRMETELDTPLQWTAAAHFNTEHPHVHVALRGIDSEGKPLQLERDFIKHGIREIAEDLCTRQLGYRTEMDAAAAERREVSAARFTSLDRAIQRRREAIPAPASPMSEFVLVTNLAPSGRRVSAAQLREQHIAERLQHLSTMGLARASEPGNWQVREDFEQVLRTMQKANDRQRMLAAHGVLMSDERLAVEVLDFRKLKSVEGRVLLHGEEEQGRNAGRPYLLLESTDARVYYVYYTPEIEEARSRGLLRTNSFARLKRQFVDGRSKVGIDDLGNSEVLLRNKQHLKAAAKQFVTRRIRTQETEWGGWLGRYQAAIRDAVAEIELKSQGRASERVRSHER